MIPANENDARQIVVDWRSAKPATRRVLVKADSVQIQTLVDGAWLAATFASPGFAARALIAHDFTWHAVKP